MRRLHALLVAVLLATAALAGCVGSDDGEDAGSQSTDDATAPEGDGDASPQASGNDTALEEDSSEVTGTIVGAGAAGCAFNLQPASDQPATFTVADDAEHLEVSLAFDGVGDVCANLYSPSQELGDDPEAQLSTTGETNWSTEDPEGGEWTVYLYGDGVGPVEGSYTVGTVQLVPVAG